MCLTSQLATSALLNFYGCDIERHTRSQKEERQKESGRENRNRFIYRLFASAESVARGAETDNHMENNPNQRCQWEMGFFDGRRCGTAARVCVCVYRIASVSGLE